jgi:RNA polymerase sigma-70 factor (sigma-E family)
VYRGVTVTNGLTDPAVVGRVPRTHDPYTSTFETYVLEHGAELARVAFLLTGDRHLAEDLVQVALSKVAPQWDRVTSRGHPGGYVRQVLVRTAVGWRRRHWRAETPAADVPDRAGRDEQAGVDNHDLMRRALLDLPARQRATVVLRFYEDRSEADTAVILRCSVGTIKSQTAKGLARLRLLLDEPSVTDPGVSS